MRIIDNIGLTIIQMFLYFCAGLLGAIGICCIAAIFIVNPVFLFIAGLCIVCANLTAIFAFDMGKEWKYDN